MDRIAARPCPWPAVGWQCLPFYSNDALWGLIKTTVDELQISFDLCRVTCSLHNIHKSCTMWVRPGWQTAPGSHCGESSSSQGAAWIGSGSSISHYPFTRVLDANIK